MDDVTLIARGGQPSWTETFDHPDHGKLVFKVEKMPDGRAWLNMAVLKEEIAPGVVAGTGAMLAEAIAGLTTIVKRPVVNEERIEDPDNPGHQKLKQDLYDPVADERWEFPVVVWNAFLAWRVKVLSPDTVEQVKNSSGATSGSDTAEPSPVNGDSPHSIPSSSD